MKEMALMVLKVWWFKMMNFKKLLISTRGENKRDVFGQQHEGFRLEHGQDVKS